MRTALAKIARSALSFSQVIRRRLAGNGFYDDDLKALKKQQGSDREFPFGRAYPILNERYAESGTMKGHYFHQDLYVARRICECQPTRHIDIGSRIDGFVAHVAAFRSIEVFDIREQTSHVKNISFSQADLMNLPERLKSCCDSVSSLHAIEHFGLGRYGDPIDYLGHKKAIDNIAEILQPNGTFYLSVPIGPQRIEFNAHRVFSVRYLLELVADRFNIARFSYIDDRGDFFENVELTENDVSHNFNCNYGCGVFELVKK